MKTLANVAGIPLNTAWRLERGRAPVLANAVKVANAFGLTVYEVWNIPGPHIIPWVAPVREKRNKLRALRLDRGWTLDELAKRSRVSKSALAQIERDRGPTLGSAVCIAAAFGLSVYDIWSIPIQETLREEVPPENDGRSDRVQPKSREERTTC